MLAACGSVTAQGSTAVPSTFTPTRRGGGGKLRLLYWQPPTILNAHFAVSAKDVAASRIVSEPPFSIAPDGHFAPILAEEFPSIENGGRGRDGTRTTWRLKRGVVWHDGEPFTADDLVFTWEFISDAATGSVSKGLYENIRRIEKLDDHTVKVVFADPTPRWYLSGGRFCRGTSLPSIRDRTYAMCRTTSNRSAPGHTGSSNSSRGMWHGTRSIPIITRPIAPSSTPSG
jgi:peptide/nickel transport system substrate-binding protein